MKTRQKILSDHKRKGKILSPPFNHLFGPLKEVSWIKTILPELLWIALIHDTHGDRRAVEIITAFSRLAREIRPDATEKWFAPASHFASLSASDYSQLRHELDRKQLIPAVLTPLSPLVGWYPECPLAPLFSKPPRRSRRDLSLLGKMVSSLYARSQRGPMMVQATATWLAFDADILKVSSDLSLAHFPEIEHYPDTDLSKQIGASIRAGLNVFFGSEIHHRDNKWPDYFWNRGLAIEPCEI
jgi:hypothetical protein